VGIKGVGMTALAEILKSSGAILTGSDSPEVFFTDEILASLGLKVQTGFNPSHLSPDIDLVIYSAAYDPASNPELKQAALFAIPCLSYPQALGELSQLYFSIGICGVHGKTTTTALSGFLAKALALPSTVLVGSEVPQFGRRATWVGGTRYFIAETCEYRRHFLSFKPRLIVLTSVEEDHLDYYRDLKDIKDAFVEYILSLPLGGKLIYCADDRGAADVVNQVLDLRPDLNLQGYGFNAVGPYQIEDGNPLPGKTSFKLKGFNNLWQIKIPGRHSVLNATAALALSISLLEEEGRGLQAPDLVLLAEALKDFRGTRRRSEVVGEAKGILFIDDYAHHPTAIKTTLEGIKDFYPHRRVIVDFMSHTYSRTYALLKEFAQSLTTAQVVVLHKIYASAREQFDGRVSGENLFQETKRLKDEVYYFNEWEEAEPFLRQFLKPGDLFITMGAGDNWKLGQALYNFFQAQD